MELLFCLDQTQLFLQLQEARYYLFQMRKGIALERQPLAALAMFINATGCHCCKTNKSQPLKGKVTQHLKETLRAITDQKADTILQKVERTHFSKAIINFHPSSVAHHRKK